MGSLPTKKTKERGWGWMLRSVRRVSRSRRRDSGCREAELQGMMKYTFRTNAHCSSRVSCATFFRATWGGRPVSRPEKTLAGILGRVSYGSKTLVQAPARAFRCLICFTLFIGLVHGMQNVQSPTIFFQIPPCTLVAPLYLA